MTEELESEEKKLGITDENKAEFFKSFIADKVYVETLPLFDGQATVTFKTLTTKETIAIFNQLKNDERNLVLTNDPVYSITLSNYRISLSLMAFDGKELAPDVTIDNFKPDHDGDSYVKSRGALMDDWTAFKTGAIADAFNKFEEKVLFLSRNVQTPNFWKADK